MKSIPLLAAVLVATTPAAAQPGAPYRALGTEPFWSLAIARSTITYRPADGRPVTVARPRPIVGINGELYRARGMTVDITHVACSDGMSDRRYRDTVRVTIGRRMVSGCGGGTVAPDGGLNGTRWTIAAIDGRPIRSPRPATISFTADQLGGKVCNGFGGAYVVRGQTLTVREIVGTQMACQDGSMRIEHDVMRIAGQPMRIARPDHRTLELSNARGRITLVAPR